LTPPSHRLLAAVCRNGHVLHDSLDPSTPPRPLGGPPGWVEGHASIGSSPSPPLLPSVPRYCGRCGASVLEGCPSCGSAILGAPKYGEQRPGETQKPDSFSWDCGKPYPWVPHEEYVAWLFDRIDYEDLDDATLLTIRGQIAVLSAPVDEATDDERVRAGSRIRNLAPEAWKAMLPVLQGLLTAEAKRRLGLP
jgi:hypothetical protein